MQIIYIKYANIFIQIIYLEGGVRGCGCGEQRPGSSRGDALVSLPKVLLIHLCALCQVRLSVQLDLHLFEMFTRGGGSWEKVK